LSRRGPGSHDCAVGGGGGGALWAARGQGATCGREMGARDKRPPSGMRPLSFAGQLQAAGESRVERSTARGRMRMWRRRCWPLEGAQDREEGKASGAPIRVGRRRRRRRQAISAAHRLLCADSGDWRPSSAEPTVNSRAGSGGHC